MKIEEIGELARLDVKPGDKFVLHCDQMISFETVQRIKAQWAACFQTGSVPPLLILPCGLRLGVVRQEEAA